MTFENIIAVDTETTGIDPWHGSQPFLITTYDVLSDEVNYWEWDVCPLTRTVLFKQDDINEFKELIEGRDLVFHNAKFDIQMLNTIGIEIDWDYVNDTSIAAHLLDSFLSKSLSRCCMTYLRIDVASYELELKEAVKRARNWARKFEPDWKIAHKDLECMPSSKDTVWKADLWLLKAIAKHKPEFIPEEELDLCATYANVDSETTGLVYKEMMRLIQQRGEMALYKERMRVLPIAYEMEKRGVSVNVNTAEMIQSEFASEAIEAGDTCLKIAHNCGYDLTLPKSGANKSLTEFLFDVLHLPVVATSKKTNAPSLSKAALTIYQETLPEGDCLEFVNQLLRKRKRDTAVNYLTSYKRFYTDPPNNLSPKDWSVMHPSINPTGTHTLRWSSKNPNEQNISKQEGFNLRRAFGPLPGREWWALDYNNLELRIPAYECQEPAMLELFEHPDDPPFYGSYHLLIFSLLYPDLFKKHGDRVKDLYKSTLYQYTKNGNFAELYGAVDTKDGKSTADRAFRYPGAQRIVSSKLKKKAALNQHYIDYANENGYVRTIADKTVDPDKGYPLVCKPSAYGVSPTVPLNYHVQGTACWVIMRAMIKCAELLKNWDDCFMIMQVHDELVFDLPKKNQAKNKVKLRKIKQLMESCGDDIGVPLTVGVDYHPANWGTVEQGVKI